MNKLSQKERVVSLGIDLFLLLIICAIAFGSLYPPVGDSGFWFYAALLSVLVGSKIVTPFYVKPVDAISYSVPAFVSLMLVNSWTEWPVETKVAFFSVSSLSGLVLIFSLLAIVLNNWGDERLQEASNKIRIFLEVFAKPQVIYTPIIIFAMYSYHIGEPHELILISIAILLTVAMSAGDFLVKTFNRIRKTTDIGRSVSIVAEIAAYQQPNIILLRQAKDNDLPLKKIVYVKDRHSNSKLALTLDLVGRDNGVLTRSVEIRRLQSGQYKELDSVVENDSAAAIEDEYLQEICALESIDLASGDSVVGIVAPDSSIERLFFEVVDNSDIEEGRLVSVNIQGKKVLYQIVGGLTREEAVHKKNTYGYLRAQAQQIGVWNEEQRKFTQFSWLPNINEPVYLEAQENYAIEPDTIGHFPDSNYQVKIGNINHLVTHNTAILGILGVGKSMLAIELLERMMSEGIKVVCLDLTDQYSSELSDYYNAPYEEACLQRLRAATDQDRDAWQENPEQGGSLPNLKNAFFEDLNGFINNTDGHLLKIYNPAEFVATRQERAPGNFQAGGQWQRGAPLFSVTPVEITKIVSETVLDILSAEMSDRARICLVYEEAHSLVPEWNSVVAEGDKHATSGTARAILQGRKFGLGCLLITQRTANVTKTILNQCNTIFAMRTFDDTGKGFLGNYIGNDYAQSLSSVKERHAVFFGRGSSCENPVLMKVNNRDDFLRSYRGRHRPPVFSQVDAIPAQEQPEPEFDDDVPF
ncbi:helicase HerA domain-containing protein [Alcanivorax sp. IL3]|uniref:helicase HerA domain-containing protein n=1 Tax=unclassified Alcanivorax TaxID=2638842 RepID=UPI0039C2E3EB